MICPICNGSQWIRKEVPVPVRIYGYPRTAPVAVPCPHCTRPTKTYYEGKR